MRKVLGWIGIVIGVIGIVSAVVERRNAAKQADFIRKQAVSFREADATWEGRAFHKGDVVRITNWAGTFKPQETGNSNEVDADYGHTGILLSGTGADSKQIVKIRWSPQKWKINGQDRWVELPQFEATIHVSYLEVVH